MLKECILPTKHPVKMPFFSFSVQLPQHWLSTNWCTYVCMHALIARGGICYGPQGQETPISQTSKRFWVRKHTSNIVISPKLSILFSKNNVKYRNFNESFGFCSSERSQDVFQAYLLITSQGDRYLKTWKSAPDCWGVFWLYAPQIDRT